MAKVTLCASGWDASDQVFSFEQDSPEAIQVFVKLVQHGAKAAGLLKPAVTVESNGHFQDISEKNDWAFDRQAL